MPIIFEASGGYFNSHLYDDLNLLETTFSTIEWKGIDNKAQFAKVLEHIYNPTHVEMIERHIGLGLHDVRIFTEGLVHSKNAKPDFYTYLDCKSEVWDTEYDKFLYKLQKLYLRPEVQFLLEENTLDFAVLDAITNFIKTRGQIMTLGAIGDAVKQKSIIKAFLEVQLLYAEKHSSYVFSRPLYVKFFKKYKKEKLSAMKLPDKVDYYWYVLRRGLHIKDMNVNRARDQHSLYTDGKEKKNWDADLYADAGRRDDPSKEGWTFINKETGKLYFWTYGKFTEIPPIKYPLMIVQQFVSKVANFPHGWMHLPRKHEMEGNPEPALTANVQKWIENRRTVESSLPRYGSEVRLGAYRDENERAILKAAYIFDKPEEFRTPIKWRYIRRYARDVHRGIKK